MIEVRAPDNTVIQFPDGTPDDVIMQVMQREYGGPSQAMPQGSMLERARQGVSDLTSGLGQGMTFGFADEIAAAGLTPIELGIGLATGSDGGKGVGERIGDAYGRAVGKVRADVKQAQERSPVLSTVGEVGGGVLSAGGLAKQGVTLLNAARPTYPGMIARGGTEGAAYGGLHGFGTGEGLEDRAQRAASGAGFGAATGGAFGALGARVANKAAQGTAPTVDDLRAAANVAYREAENANVVVNPQRYAKMVDDLFTDLANDGFHPDLHKGVMAAFKSLEDLKGHPVPFQTLDLLRRIANSAGKSIANRDEGRLAGKVVDKIDDLMGGLRQSDVLFGDPQKAVTAITKGRELWSRMRKSEMLEGIMERAGDRVGANYTAAGFQTAVRQEIKSILKNPKLLRGFSQDERDMMRSIVRGASVENFLKHVGKLAPRGIVGATLGGGAGYTLGGPAGAAAVWGIGEAAKRGSTAITNKKLNNLVELVRRGGPRVINALRADQRALLDSAIAAGVLLPDELGLMPQRQPALATQ